MIQATVPQRGARKLTADDVDLVIDHAEFGFATTDELEPLDEIVGQPRALRALDLGLGIEHPSYNIYVAGLSGMGKQAMIRRALTERVGRHPTPPDWVYLSNFDEPDCPLAVSLEPGRAQRLKRDVEQVVEQLQEELPKAFRHEDFSRETQRLNQEFQERGREMSRELDRLAEEKGLTVQRLPNGEMAALPVRDGELVTPDEIQDLSDEERDELERRQRELAEEAARLMARQQEVGRKLHASLRQIERDFAARYVNPLVDELAGRYESPKLREWLRRLKADLVEQHERFRDGEDEKQPPIAMMLGGAAPEPEERFRRYQVNVLVDNGGVEGAPVVVEESPNYKNLFGIIDRDVDRFGHGSTDFTRIKAGSLLRANGGYLVFNLMDALIEPVVWKELKRTIKSGRLQIELYEPLGLFSISPLKPEPIPLRLKLVVVGNPLIYHLLYLMDEDFREIFKVKAEFSPDMERDSNAGTTVGRLLQKLNEDGERLLPFDAEAVAELLRAGARLVDHREKVTAEFSRLADVAREASYWASRGEAEVVGGRHVRQALDERVYRSDLIAARIRELIAEGALRITLDGTATGQVNGLAVADLGDYAFGRPSRVTASVGVGAAGVINIERESKLSGRTYDKGMLILEGYLRGTYARQGPLALSASLAMEQNYGMIDGDSASAAELVCLLSALAGAPLRQDVAITGSVNQRGEIQAVGGINEKVEGFFDVCRERGLTGRQGVVLPSANVRNLVLRPDVVEAVGSGELHLWAIDHIDQGLELLTGLAAGEVGDEGSVHGRVQRRLRELAEALKSQQAVAVERPFVPFYAEPTSPHDPRPPLPGRGRCRDR